MILLSIDPGATSGWVRYCTDHRRVLAAGKFRGEELPVEATIAIWHQSVVESLIPARGQIFPAVVEASITQGHLERQLLEGGKLNRITRHEVKQILTAATLREPVVTDDKTAWQALQLLHGEGSGRKTTKKAPGGCIGDVSSHERAALAACVAWAIREGVWKP